MTNAILDKPRMKSLLDKKSLFVAVWATGVVACSIVAFGAETLAEPVRLEADTDWTNRLSVVGGGTIAADLAEVTGGDLQDVRG